MFPKYPLLFQRYFFVTLNYWLGSDFRGGPLDGVNLSESELELGEGGEAKKIEKEPTHLHLGVSVQVSNQGPLAYFFVVPSYH